MFVPHNASPNRTCTTASLFVDALSQTSVVILDRSCQSTGAVAPYAQAIYRDDGATLDDLREAVTTLEDAARIARRVLGGSHPTTMGIEVCLRLARAALRARETPSPGAA